MYFNIYEVDSIPITQSRMDACSIGEHYVFIEKYAVVKDLEDKEKSDALRAFGKWLKAENLGVLKKSEFILNSDVTDGKHFADRYAGFHKIAKALSDMTADDFLHRFHDICNLTAELKKSVVDEDDDYVFLSGTTLLTMDEFLRLAETGRTYYIGSICKYHQ